MGRLAGPAIPVSHDGAAPWCPDDGPRTASSWYRLATLASPAAPNPTLPTPHLKMMMPTRPPADDDDPELLGQLAVLPWLDRLKCRRQRFPRLRLGHNSTAPDATLGCRSTPSALPAAIEAP